MDEGVLNDLLECSVCLERLDTSSRVLPCQHTFCIQCLREIIYCQKELRCPECRVLVETPVDELPPNVLLMRILEGMRNSGGQRPPASPPPAQIIPRRPIIGPATFMEPVSSYGFTYSDGDGKHTNVIPKCTPHARAICDYFSKEPGDLSFKKNEVIILRRQIDTYWFHGETGGNQGAFPITFAKIIVPLPPAPPQCTALYDFHMAAHEEEGCLAFNKGAVINVIRRVDENWAEGRLHDKIGIFPIAFVEMNQSALSIINIPAPIPSNSDRIAPSTPANKAVPRSTPGTVTNKLPQQFIQKHATQRAVLLSNQNKNEHLGIVSPRHGAKDSPLTSTPRTTHSHHHREKEKRNSLTPGGQIVVSHTSLNRHSAEILGPCGNLLDQDVNQESSSSKHNEKEKHRGERERQDKDGSFSITEKFKDWDKERNRKTGGNSDRQPVPYVALYPYKPQKPDELELKKGGIYMVLEQCQDGWFKGCSSRTQKCGVFPGNYVIPASKVQISSKGRHYVTTPHSGSDDMILNSTCTKANKESSNSTNNKTKNCAEALQTSQFQIQPPDLPPRCQSPTTFNSNVSTSCPWSSPKGSSSKPEKSKEKNKVDKSSSSGVSLMKRLAGMTKSRSPPPSTHGAFSMDNPVFEDTPEIFSPSSGHDSSGQQTVSQQGVHIRTSGDTPWLPASTRHHHHRKSHSLDAGQQLKSGKENTNQPINKRFRCIVAYPPNSEYELELQVDDVVLVHKQWGEGWYKGTLERTGHTGLVPASFVEAC